MRGSLHLLVREKGSVVLLIWRRQTCRSRYLSPVFAFPANLYVAVIPDYHRHCNAVVKRFVPPFRLLVYPSLLEFDRSFSQRAARLIASGTISERVYNHRCRLIVACALSPKCRQALISFQRPCLNRRSMSTALELMSKTAATHAPGTPSPKVMARR